jgi:hypothetical protein
LIHDSSADMKNGWTASHNFQNHKFYLPTLFSKVFLSFSIKIKSCKYLMRLLDHKYIKYS